jgi:hypothetical protein
MRHKDTDHNAMCRKVGLEFSGRFETQFVDAPHYEDTCRVLIRKDLKAASQCLDLGLTIVGSFCSSRATFVLDLVKLHVWRVLSLDYLRTPTMHVPWL